MAALGDYILMLMAIALKLEVGDDHGFIANSTQFHPLRIITVSNEYLDFLKFVLVG